ncbi:MAG: patatin-like phospholipase family protein [Gemmatimonadaceae bacterium]
MRGPHPRVAVVLSGGSAKGLADIGALEVLEELGVPVDLVTGTSMGAIVGGLYAAGYSAPELAKLIDEENWNTFFKRPTDRRLQRKYERQDDERFTITFPLDKAIPNLPAGVISRQSLSEHLERYLWPVHDVTNFMKLPTPFAALATDLATGDAILLTSGSLAQAIEGSAAVPGVFAPLTLPDGRVVVDGAVNRNIPAEDAKKLGADILICIDVSERVAPVNTLRSLVDVVDQTVAFRVQASNAIERPLCNVIIEPDISGLSSADFGLSSTWVKRGRTAALEHRTELQDIANRARAARGPVALRPPVPSADSIFVRTVLWSKVSEGADAVAHGAITLGDSDWVTPADVETAVSRMFATGRFDQVSYRIVPRDNGIHDLVFDLTESDRDLLGVGVRYDTPRGTSLLASAKVTDFLSPGSTASLSARVGQIQQFDARDVFGERFNARFLQTYHVTLTRTPLPNLTVPGTTSMAVLDVRQVAGEIEHSLVRELVLDIGLSREWSTDGAKGATGLFGVRSQSFTVLSAGLTGDNRDAIVTPDRGGAFFWRSDIANPALGGGGSFSRHVLSAEGAKPVFPGISIVGKAFLGGAIGPDISFHDLFFLGGSVPTPSWSGQFVEFLGLDPQSLAGRSVQVVQAGVQANAPEGIVVALRGNIGNVFAAWPSGFHRSGYQTGFGLTATSQFAPGPVALSIGTRSLKQRPVVELSFGASF